MITLFCLISIAICIGQIFQEWSYNERKVHPAGVSIGKIWLTFIIYTSFSTILVINKIVTITTLDELK